jgi:hypothetical protein
LPLAHLLFGLVYLAEGGISVEVTEPCPGRAQIIPALEARLPGVTGPGATRKLELERGADGLTLRLREPDGAVALERRLAPAVSNEGCEALAEAVALVVVRYLRELGYQPPAAAPPPPPAPVVVAQPPLPPPSRRSGGYLGVAGAARAGTLGATRGEGLLGFQLHFGRFGGELAAGASTESVVPVFAAGPEAALRLRSFPLHLGLDLPLRLTPSMFLVPMAGMGLEVLSFRATGLSDARQGVRLEPAVEAGVSYLLAGESVFGRLSLTGGLNLGPRDFDAGLAQPVFRTPGAYLRVQIEVGVVLWKNDGPPGL